MEPSQSSDYVMVNKCHLSKPRKKGDRGPYLTFRLSNEIINYDIIQKTNKKEYF